MCVNNTSNIRQLKSITYRVAERVRPYRESERTLAE